MIRNYLKTTWRNLLKSKGLSFINISGLAIGITSFVLISLYIVNELSYDRFHSHYKNIYRVNVKARSSAMSTDLATSHLPLAKTLVADYPEVSKATRILKPGPLRIGVGNEYYSEEKMLYADANFPDVFDFKLIKGNSATALINPRSLVLTETCAKKYFGNDDPIGKHITIEDDSILYVVTAIIEDAPANSHIKFDIVGSMSSNNSWNDNRWIGGECYTYVMLNEDVRVEALEKKIQKIVYEHIAPEITHYTGLTMAQWEKSGNRTGYYLIPLKNIHLHSTSTMELEPGSNISYIYTYAFIGFIILFIAIFNFVNLATVQSTSRVKEVGVRKVIGSTKTGLVYQFILESVFISVFATILGGILVKLLTPYFETLVGRQLAFNITSSYVGLVALLFLAVVVGFLAGSYPAFVLASFRPVNALERIFNQPAKSGWLRSSLVVLQFTASIAIIIVTLVVYNQLQYMLTKNLGFDKEQILAIRRSDLLKGNLESFRNDLLLNTNIRSVANSKTLPGKTYDRRSYRRKGSPESYVCMFDHVSFNYNEVMGLKLLSGRFFSKDFSLDSNAVVINETLAKNLGFKDPIGQRLTSAWHRGESLQIIGVVKDYNIESLRKKIEPLALEMIPDNTNGYVTVKIANDKNIRQTVQYIHDSWSKHSNGKLFESFFFDDDYENLYKSDFATRKVLVVFASLSILIACLGLFGLVTLTIERRTKEIGIRKVLGASVTGIVQMVSKDFLKLVLIAAVVAFPLAWYFMNKWLQDFAYRISIGWWVFIVAGSLAIIIAFVTIGFQAMKAGVANPVKSLRTE